MKSMKNKGISLIVLVITIVVMIILAATIILTLSGNNITQKANEAKFKNDLASLKSELAVVIAEEDIKNAKNGILNGDREDGISGIDINNKYSKLIPDSLKKYVIISNNREIIYINAATLSQAKWAKDEQIKVIDSSLYTTIYDVKELMDLARKYVAEGKSTTSPNLLALQYIRNKRSIYTSTAWTAFAGSVDSNFVTYVNNNKEGPLEFLNIVDGVTGNKIDLIHMMASLNVYCLKDYAMIYEYACWAGDLCTLGSQVGTYNSSGNYTVDDLVLYTNTLLGTKTTSSTFSLEDMLADVDAINLSTLITGTDDLDTAFYNYYVGDSVGICKNRYEGFYNYLMNPVYEDSNVVKIDGNDRIYDIVMSYTGAHSGATAGKAQAMVLVGISTYASIPNKVWQAVATSFSRYINSNR